MSFFSLFALSLCVSLNEMQYVLIRAHTALGGDPGDLLTMSLGNAERDLVVGLPVKLGFVSCGIEGHGLVLLVLDVPHLYGFPIESILKCSHSHRTIDVNNSDALIIYLVITVNTGSVEADLVGVGVPLDLNVFDSVASGFGCGSSSQSMISSAANSGTPAATRPRTGTR